jgi:hypothetical protein
MSGLLTAVEARLRELSGLKQVAGAVSWAQLQDSGKVPPAHQQPAAFVVPLGETAGPQHNATGAHRQRLTLSVGVVLLVGTRNDPHGEAAVDAVKPLADTLRDYLTGWVPTGGEALRYRRGHVVGFHQSTVFWLAEFETGELLRKP